MCGIVAYLAERDPPNDYADRLIRSTDALRHRGPDDQGTWFSPDRRCGLGHRRLAVHGGNNANQPILNESGSIALVVNGEFYDPGDEIRRRLVLKGHRFRTSSDSELAIHLYEEHGLDFVQHLRGEFAIVLYDSDHRRIVAVRDRFGIKPLVYRQRKGTWWFASQVRALAAAGLETEIDDESVWHATSFQYLLPHRTLARDVFQLTPGQMAVARGGQIRLHQYWDCDYPRLKECQTDHRGDESIYEEFRTRMDEAVRIRLRGDVPVVAHLSGGVDSAAVVGAANEGLAAAFTVAFPGREDYDELMLAQRVADRAAVRLHTVDGSPNRLVETVPEAVDFSEGTAVNGHLPAKFLLNQAIGACGYKVTLTGEGADELLAGYPHLRIDWCRAEGRNHLVSSIAKGNMASRGVMLATERGLDLGAVRRRLGYLPAFLEAKASLGRLFRSHLHEDFLDAFVGRDAYAELLDVIATRDQLDDRHLVHQSLYLWNKTALAQYILRTLGDGCESAHGVEGRLPMLDHHLFEWVRELPLTMLLRPTDSDSAAIEKWILRQSVRGRVPDVVANRPKHPFVAPPLSDALLHPGLPRDVVEAAIDDHPYYDSGKLRTTLGRVSEMSRQQRIAIDPLWWNMLSLAPRIAASKHDPFALRANA